MGKLVQVDTFTVSSAVASVTLGGGFLEGEAFLYGVKQL